jgi:hypothetical protein
MLDRGEGVAAYRPRKDDGDAFGDADTQMQQLQSSTSRFKADRGFKVCLCVSLLYIVPITSLLQHKQCTCWHVVRVHMRQRI